MAVLKDFEEDDKLYFVDENNDGIDDRQQSQTPQQAPVRNEVDIPEPSVVPENLTQPEVSGDANKFALEKMMQGNKQEVKDLQAAGDLAAAPLSRRAEDLETSDRDLERQDRNSLIAGLTNAASLGLDGATSFKDRQMNNSEARQANTNYVEGQSKEQAARQAISEKLRARAEVERTRGLSARMTGAQAEQGLNANTVASINVPIDYEQKGLGLTKTKLGLEDEAVARKRVAESNDPNSVASQNARKSVLDNYKIDLPVSMSAARVQELMDGYKTNFTTSVADETKRELAKNTSEDNRFKWAQLQAQIDATNEGKAKTLSDKADLKAEKAASDKKKDDELTNVSGYERMEGMRVLPKDANSVRDLKAKFDTFVSGLQKLKDLQKQFGNFETGAVGEEMKTLSIDLQTTQKELDKLGALTGPDMSLMKQKIPTLGGWDLLASRNSNAQAQLETTNLNSTRTFDAYMTNLGYRKKGSDRMGSGPLSNTRQLTSAKDLPPVK